jgi:DNA repair protein SbcC/Rad50
VTDVPLQSLFISDFRRLEGHRLLPLDARTVLIHGPNGTGKTSVLSALELALTGEIRSMRRHDPWYTAHLPFHGQEFATVRAVVSKQLAASTEPITMTVGGSRIDGAPALDLAAAQFYAERCYLDQVSLGQLLDLYQYREGKEESALARFVNELLGLEQLDALRSGLSDATDFRLLKKLSDALAQAETQAQRANTDLSLATKELEPARVALARCRETLAEALGKLGHQMPEADDQDFGLQTAELLRASRQADDRPVADLHRKLTALGGRIEGLSNRPSVKRLEEARAAFAVASARRAGWREKHQAAIKAWRADVTRLDVHLTGEEPAALDDELQRVRRSIARQDELIASRARLEEQLADRRATLLNIQAQFSASQEQAGSLVEGLAALRQHSSDNKCPVCDRNFDEVSSTHLTAHIDQRIAELTSHGLRLRELRAQRDSVENEVRRDERLIEQIRGELLSDAQREAANSRSVALINLHEQFQRLQPAIKAGLELLAQARSSEAELKELEAIAGEATVARSELQEVARALGASPPDDAQPLQESWRRLSHIATERLAQADALQQTHAAASELLKQTIEHGERVARLKDTVMRAAERKNTWEERVREARRRQAVARKVLDTSSKARATIVQRVFTESLNDVWRSVFTRLAPREPFTPSFGIPTSSKTALELTLRTVHTSGEPGGSPQMMLSAGNLNTAALSLFIALHLAVEPLVKCLVFDDPVQSMDEVHVAQFAALIRGLSKYDKRQVIIAVHERELFEYLALELSPAFEGDELITIELGVLSEAKDRGVTRRTWSPDRAIAV